MNFQVAICWAALTALAFALSGWIFRKTRLAKEELTDTGEHEASYDANFFGSIFAWALLIGALISTVTLASASGLVDFRDPFERNFSDQVGVPEKAAEVPEPAPIKLKPAKDPRPDVGALRKQHREQLDDFESSSVAEPTEADNEQ